MPSMEPNHISKAKAAFFNSYNKETLELVVQQKQGSDCRSCSTVLWLHATWSAKAKWSSNSDQKRKFQGKKTQRQSKRAQCSLQTAHITRKLVSYLKILVFDKPNKELKFAMKMPRCIRTMSQMRALGPLGSLLLKNLMLRCRRAPEALLLPRGAAWAVLSKGVLNDEAGLLPGFPSNNVHTLSLNIPKHSTHRCNSSDKTAALHCSCLSPQAYCNRVGKKHFSLQTVEFLIFSSVRLVQRKKENL